MEKEIKIMLVDNDFQAVSILESFLNMKGYSTTACLNAIDAVKFYESHPVDLVISEISLPDMDGFSLIEKLKKIDNDVPLIFLTRRSSRIDIARGYDIGADDYIIKPYSLEELAERVKAVCRRAVFNRSQEYVYHLSSYTFNVLRHVLIRGEKEKNLTSRELELLLLFCKHKNRVLERSVILERVWKEDNRSNARNMDVYVTKLRKLFDDDPCVELQNIHGIGYKLYVKE